MRLRRLRTLRDAGQASAEFVGVVAVAAVVVLALLGASYTFRFGPVAASAVCRVAAAVSGGSGAGCAGAAVPGGGSEEEEPWYCRAFGVGCPSGGGGGGSDQGESEDESPDQGEDQPWYCDVFGIGCQDEDQGPQVDLPPGLDPDSPIVEDLMSTERGRQTLQYLADHDIQVVVDPKQKGAYYSDGTIVLGEGQDNASVVVHEGNHARYDEKGRHADPQELDRDAFIAAAIDEEADGLVQQILAAKEFRGAGRDAGMQPAEQQYDAAYQEARGAGRSEAEAQRAAADAVRDAFYDGSLVASTSGASYSDFYGAQWDRVN